MKLAIMQPYFFPYIGYWQLLAHVDKYVVFDDVAFKKRSWMTRNRIPCDGQEKIIGLQIINASQNKNVNETELLYNEAERCKILATLKHAYRKAPYKEETLAFLEPVIMNKKTNLADFLYESIVAVADYFDINTEILRSQDLRGAEHLHAQEGILELCEKVGCDAYSNAIGGTELYDKEVFKSHGIDLTFLKTDFDKMAEDFSYSSGYSIIDLMMNLPKEDVKKQLNYFELV